MISRPVVPLCTFKRVYYSTTALLLAALVCLPALVPLSFLLLGFDPSVQYAATVDSFQAYRVTAPFRRGIAYGVLLLAGLLLALSIAGLILRGRRQTDLPWLVLAVTTIAATTAAGLVVVSLLAPGGMCC